MLDLANGSTFLEISRGNFKSMPVPRPEVPALEILDQLLSPLHAWCAATVTESARLAQLRDTLLPPLLSGKLRVGTAGVLVGEAV